MDERLLRFRSSLESAPVIWKGDYPYVIHPLTDGVERIDADLMADVSGLIHEMIEWREVDAILAIEAMGLPIATALSQLSGKPLLVVRKRSYGLAGEVEVEQTTGYGGGKLYLNGIGEGEGILLVDDFLSTGGTLMAVLQGLGEIGANVCEVSILVEKASEVKAGLEAKYRVPINSLVRLEMRDGRAHILD